MNISSDPLSLRLPLTWREELKQCINEVRARCPFVEREHYGRALQWTLTKEVYPAFEELLDEFTRNGIGGQIYGRDTDYAVILRLEAVPGAIASAPAADLRSAYGRGGPAILCDERDCLRLHEEAGGDPAGRGRVPTLEARSGTPTATTPP